MAEMLRSKRIHGRQRHPKQVHAGLPNAHHQDRSDHACHARTGASPPAAAAGRTVCPAAAAGGLAQVRA